MLHRKIILLCAILLSLVGSFAARAQQSLGLNGKKDAFSQTYNSKADSLQMKDSTDKMINFNEIFGGMAHKREMRIGTMFGTSLIIPGTSQIYNQQYWKLPIFYTGIAAGIAGGCYHHFEYEKTQSAAHKNGEIWSFVTAGIFYYASLMDGAACYKSNKKPLPGRSTIYSILCPGLGQAYNGEYWKIPIYVGGLVGSAHFFFENRTNYIRYRDIYRASVESGYVGPITSDQAKYYRDMYRRYRDYSVLAFGLVYLLQIIDANVFAYMQNFEVTEDVYATMAPTVVIPDSNTNIPPAPGVGFALRF